MNLIEAMKIAEGVLAQYKIDQLKWWKRLDGTPMLNDLAVLFSLAFMEASIEKKDSTHRCKVGRVCDPETCTRALIEDKPNVSTSTNSSAPADVAAVRDAALEEAAIVCDQIADEINTGFDNDAEDIGKAIRAMKSAAPTAQSKAGQCDLEKAHGIIADLLICFDDGVGEDWNKDQLAAAREFCDEDIYNDRIGAHSLGKNMGATTGQAGGKV